MRVTRVPLKLLVGVMVLLAQPIQLTPTQAAATQPVPWHPCARITMLGNTPPSKVTVNEMTTVASVWTHAQFLDGTAIKGNALSLKIAAGNVLNFVGLQTGGWGVGRSVVT